MEQTGAHLNAKQKNAHEFRLQGVKIGSNLVLRGTVGH